MTKKTVYILFFLLVLQVSYAQQYPSDGQYQSIAPPNAPALPDYGQSVTDESVPSHIKITRVTEAQGTWYPTHEYAKTQVWNVDQTRYKISSWKVYNATTYDEERELSSMYPSYWSNTDPDIIWSFRDDGYIKKYHVSTDVTETVAHITGYDVIKLGPGEGNIDKNDHYVALVGKKANGNTNDLDVLLFDLTTNQVTKTIKFAGAWDDGNDYAPKYIDWVSVSQSGDYVVVLWANAWNEGVGYYKDQNNVDHYGLEVYNRSDLQYLRRIDNAAGHGDLGYAVDGDEVFVQYKTGEIGVYMHKLNGNGGNANGEILVNESADFTASGHVSCRNINRPGWAYITVPDKNSNGDNLSAQIVALKLDDSGIAEHFGHHFSSDVSYAQSAMAVASPDGDIICFKSDFKTSPGNGDVVYSFFATLANPLAVEWTKPSVYFDKNEISIYPNPAHDEIHIASKKEVLRQINIYNHIGQLVQSLAQKSNVVNIESLPRGVYWIRITEDAQTSTIKLVKE